MMHLVDDALETKDAGRSTGWILRRIGQSATVLIHPVPNTTAQWIAVVRGHRGAVAGCTERPAGIKAVNGVVEREELLGLARGRGEQLGLIDVSTEAEPVV